jgi:hypothetical protein
MRAIAVILLLVALSGCFRKRTEHPDIPASATDNKDTSLMITAIDMNFPLRISDLDLRNSKNVFHPNDGVVSKINNTVRDFYNTSCVPDSQYSYKDTYINTIRLRDSLQTIYLVLLRYYPTEDFNCMALFYDNERKEFADEAFEFKLYALYSFDEGKLKSTTLKTGFNLTFPEVELVDYNKDGINDYRFTRLFHNGTFNAIHTTILTIKDPGIDTLYFHEKWLSEF